jgi:uncharacterized cupredoxin-like copper-binding protein
VLHRSKLSVLTVLVLLATGAVLSGCGDDEEEGNGETQAATQTAGGGGEAQTVDVSEVDFAIEPANPTVRAGTVTLNVTNDGQAEHTLEVEGPGGESVLEPALAPGESGKLEVELNEPGKYKWYCPIGNHEQQGMVGEVTVTG